MKKNRTAVIIAAFAVFIAIGFISVMSVKVGGREGYFGTPLIFSFGGKAELRNTIEIPLSKADKLRLDYGSKNIKVYPAEGDTVTIKEYLYSNKPEARAEVSYGKDGNALVRGGQGRSFVIFGFFVGEGERIEVCIPEKSLSQLSLETGSGNITSETDCVREDGVFEAKAGSGNVRISNVTADAVVLEAGSGNVRAENIEGSVTLEANSGNIDGKEITGDVSADSGSGNIRIEKLSGGITAGAGSGNVTVEAAVISGDVALSAGSGNVKLVLPKGVDFHFRGETGSGNINTDFDEILSYDKKGDIAEGDAGQNPDIKIETHTGSGNITVRYR